MSRNINTDLMEANTSKQRYSRKPAARGKKIEFKVPQVSNNFVVMGVQKSKYEPKYTVQFLPAKNLKENKLEIMLPH